jgi:hypothetical protein
MLDPDLLYIKARQRELWDLAAASRSVPRGPSARPGWRAWWQHCLDALRTVYGWCIPVLSIRRPVPVAVRVAQHRCSASPPRQER